MCTQSTWYRACPVRLRRMARYWTEGDLDQQGLANSSVTSFTRIP